MWFIFLAAGMALPLVFASQGYSFLKNYAFIAYIILIFMIAIHSWLMFRSRNEKVMLKVRIGQGISIIALSISFPMILGMFIAPECKTETKNEKLNFSQCIELTKVYLDGRY